MKKFLLIAASLLAASALLVGPKAASARETPSQMPSADHERSVSKIAFGPPGILFAADWREGKVYAYRLPEPVGEADRPFNLLDLQGAIAAAVGTSDFTLRDMVMRPGTSEAYVAVDATAQRLPVILRVLPSGNTTKLALDTLPHSAVQLTESGGGLTFWDHVPERTYTVTDMKWHRDRLYVAGLANRNFSSTLRILRYPFSSQTLTSIEMYHTLHDQLETRAPIRAMTFATVNGADTLLAGYLCSPLVAIPVASLHDGAHVRAKTLAELGVAGIPQSMIAYDQPDMKTGKSYPFILVTERYRPSVAIPLAGIAKEAAGPGLNHPPAMSSPAAANLGGMVEGFDGALRIDNQNGKYFIALRRNLDTGAAQLVSYEKAASFRLSDADISEYMFPQYRYRGAFQTNMILPLQNQLKTDEGYPDLVIPEPK